jgi:hypothetical protein
LSRDPDNEIAASAVSADDVSLPIFLPIGFKGVSALEFKDRQYQMKSKSE